MSLHLGLPFGRNSSFVQSFITLCITLFISWFTATHSSAQTEVVGATAGTVGVTPAGGASYSIPIAVPVGTTGVQPKLALQYNSQAGNGLVGIGFSVMGISTISRCPTDNYFDDPANGGIGVDPVDYDNNDKFCLNGQRMVTVNGVYGADGTEYRTAFESFDKIISHGNTGGAPTSFTVYKKSGEIFTYGKSVDSRIIGQSKTQVGSWALKRISDIKGNYVQFHYYNNQSTGEFYLTKIDYTGNDVLGLAPYNHIDFIYENRADPITAYMSGNKVQITKRLKVVKVYTENQLFHEYRLTYETGTTSRSRLASVTECANATTCFKPTVFTWSSDGGADHFTKTDVPSNLKFLRRRASGRVPKYFRHSAFASGDFNGDGLTDFVAAEAIDDDNPGASNSAQYLYMADRNGSFLKSTVLPNQRIANGTRTFVTGDFNGDGITDFYVADPHGERSYVGSSGAQNLHISNGNGTFSISAVPDNQKISAWNTPMVIGDFNGDGRTDFLTGDPHDKYSYVADQGAQYVHIAGENGTFQKITLADSEKIYAWHKVFASGDFNGDGLTDFLTANAASKKSFVTGDASKEQYVHLSKGNGGFIRIALSTNQKINPWHDVFASGDFNGDGLTDFITVDPRENNGYGADGNAAQYIHLSKGDGTFVKNELALDQRISHNRNVFVTGDFNGDGLTDFLTADRVDGSGEGGVEGNDQYYHISKGNGTFVRSKVPSAEAIGYKRRIQVVGDFNGDGLTDFFTARPKKYDNDYSQNLHLSNNKTPDYLTSITNGHGLKSDFVYKSMMDSTVYTKGIGATYPLQDQISSAQVVSEVRADNDVGGQNTQKYEYSGLRTHVKGLGSLGFEKMVVTDVSTGIKTDSVYSQDFANHTQGLLKNSKTIAPSNVVMEEKTVNWSVRFLASAENVPRCFRFTPSTTTVTRDLNGAFMSRVMEETTFDDYGFPTKVTMTTSNEDYSEAHSKITNNTYTHNANTWRLGRLTAANVTHKTGHVEPEITRREETVDDTQTIQENFEGVVQGWSNNSVYDGGSSYSKFLGRNSGSSGNQSIAKTFSYSGSPNFVNIEFDLYEIGYWINDDFKVFVNDQEIAKDNFVTLSSVPSGYRSCEGNTSGQSTHNFSTHTATGSLGGSTTQTHKFVVSVPTSVLGTGNTIKVGFGSDNLGWRCTKSGRIPKKETLSGYWGIDNLKINLTTRQTVTVQDYDYSANVTSSDSAQDKIRRSSFTYDADGLLESETVEPGNALFYTKTNTRNGFGAITAVTETWGSTGNDGITETSRTSSFTYDSKVRFKLTETNPLGQSQTNVYDPIRGQLISSTGPNGLTTTTTYDAFGRKTREERADGTFTNIYIEECGGSITCPSSAVFRTRQVDSAGAEGIVFTDKLNREIRKQSILDGRVNIVDTTYDALGRVTAKSEPYFEGDTIYNSTISFDILGRPLNTTMADGSTQSVVYNGLTQTSTNENGQTKTVTKDVMGRSRYITDNAGQQITYNYDSLGQMTSMTGAGRSQSFTYDIRGNKISDTDPDKGTWAYRYNALGQLVEQTDAKGQVTQITFDVLGRMLTRIDDANGTAQTSTWTYDTAPGKGIGKLHTAQSNGYLVTNVYDTLGRPSSSTENIDGTDFTSSTTFDGQSRPLTVTYPSGLTIRNSYNATGELTKVTDNSSNVDYWTRLDVDARGNVTRERLGNGVETTRTYTPENGRLSGIFSAKDATSIQHLTYQFDAVGNITNRFDQRLNQTETFVYDNLNRVVTVNTTVASTTTTTTMTYDATGNILSKSDVGNYTYGQAHSACTSGFAGPHALTTVAGTKNATYCYDANGNMLSGDGRTVQYSSFDKPIYMSKGGNTVQFFYGPDRKRFKRIDNTVAKGTVTTIYAAGKSYERIQDANGTRVKHYIGGFAVVTQTVGATSPFQTSYLHKDHLGSTDTITDESGQVIQRMSFDTWGKRREINWQALSASAITNFNTDITTRGYTGHEQIDEVGLIHMNGRVYDAELGRFLSADPNVQAPDNLQNWNRYSYVLNNPMSYTDPTGYFFSKLFKSIGKAFGKLFSAIGRVFKKLLQNPIVRAVIQIAICSIGAPACALAAGAMSAIAGGSIGDAIKAAAFAFISAGVWEYVGFAIEGLSQVGQALVHGVVNGALTAAQGGNFLVGFVTGAIGKATSFISDVVSQGNMFLDTLIVAASGCAGAVIAGGSCANGAITAAFANLYNKWQTVNRWLDRIQVGLDVAGIAPGVGNAADILNAAIYFARGNVQDGLLSLGAALPGGQAIAVARIARRVCSFHESTQVKTDRGFVPIKDVKLSDKVWARDEHTGEMKYQSVLDAYSNPYKETVYIKIKDIKTGQEQTIISNRIHPFYVSTIQPGLKLVAHGGVVLSGTNDTGEWIEAQYLHAGHRLHNADNSWSEVMSVDIVKQDLKAYNIHVDQFHTFYVRGAANDNAKPVWVHNCGKYSLDGMSLSEAKKLVGRWNKGNEKNRAATIRKHFNKHGDDFGGSLAKYLRSADGYQPKGKGIPNSGFTPNARKWNYNGRFIIKDEHGKILSYGRQ